MWIDIQEKGQNTVDGKMSLINFVFCCEYWYHSEFSIIDTKSVFLIVEAKAFTIDKNKLLLMLRKVMWAEFAIDHARPQFSLQ